MAKATRRCFKKVGGNYLVGKMCNPVGATTKYASGKATKKPALGLTRRQKEAVARGEKPKRIGKVSKTKKDGTQDKRFGRKPTPATDRRRARIAMTNVSSPSNVKKLKKLAARSAQAGRRMKRHNIPEVGKDVDEF
tara:strand:+ start:80 stop:487 length:408 start_codon:yes stop_codon:yes gene_type:complete